MSRGETRLGFLQSWPSSGFGWVALIQAIISCLPLTQVINKAGGLVYQRNFAGRCILRHETHTHRSKS